MSGNTRPQSSEPLWTDPGLKNGISVRELMSISFFFFFLMKAQAGNELSNILPRSSLAKEKPPPPPSPPFYIRTGRAFRLLSGLDKMGMRYLTQG